MKRLLITAALALVLTGLIVVRIIPRKHSQGLTVGVIKAHCLCAECYQDDSGRPRIVLLRVNKDGSLIIGGEPIALGQVTSRLDGIYSTRMPKVRQLFVDINDSVSYQQAVAVIDSAAESSVGVQVLLVTPSTREACRRVDEWFRPSL
jgi:biopolymer transport protein ExbD